MTHIEIVLLLTMLILGQTAAIWINPVKLMRIDSDPGDVQVYSYKDPKTMLNHVVLAGYGSRTYYYRAVTDSGTVVHSYEFELDRTAYKAIIRGADNGKNLFIAMSSTVPGSKLSAINFVESLDGGVTWRPTVYIGKMDTDRFLLDLVYTKESERVFVFFIHVGTRTLRLVTKQRDSITFGDELTAAGKIMSTRGTVGKAGYSKPWLHVLYTSDNYGISYVTSKDSGVTWTAPRVIASKPVIAVTNVVTSSAGYIFTAAAAVGSGPAALFASLDGGSSFFSSMPLTHGAYAGNYNNGLALCGAESKQFLASFTTTERNGAEYYRWEPKKSMQKAERWTPFEKTGVVGVSLSCANDPTGKTVLAAFVVRTGAVDPGLYFASETVDPVA